MFFTKKKVADAQDALVLQLAAMEAAAAGGVSGFDQAQVRLPRDQVADRTSGFTR
jgi:hypothetical protein